MKGIHYIKGEAYLENYPLKKLAQEIGTPCYVYSRHTLEENYDAFDHAFFNKMGSINSHQICYAVKANSNLTLLNLLSRLGSGFDIVSQGELERVLTAGGDPQKIIFSGVGKKADEINFALQQNIYCFNVESEAELEQIHTLAEQQNIQAPIALRINPDIDPQTHPYIATGLKANKFGIERHMIKALQQKLKKMPHVKLLGLACHIGSQLVSLAPFIEVGRCLHELYLDFSAAGFALKHLNVGGGLGVRYQNETPPSREEYVAAIKECFSTLPIKLILEPGRSIVAEAGILLTQVEYIKSTSTKNFAIVDVAMNDFLRPALYQAWHDIIPLSSSTEEVKTYDLVGPICESADFIGQERRLRLQAGDLLAVLMMGAYGFSMSSNYNSRPRPAEVLVDNDKIQLIRRRETIKELFALEQIPGKRTRKLKALTM